MNIYHDRILKLSRKMDISKMTLREIGDEVGIKHPQTVKNSIIKLRKLGLLDKAKSADFMKEMKNVIKHDAVLYQIPVLGYANCGEATLLAEENFQGYLTVSSSIVKKRPNMFALIASGDSMNNANIDGDHIDDGDYVIIDGNQQNPKDGDYVLSVIEGSANIKLFKRDVLHNTIVLISQSFGNYQPIYIHENDYPGYLVNGKVVKVIKKPNIK